MTATQRALVEALRTMIARVERMHKEFRDSETESGIRAEVKSAKAALARAEQEAKHE